MLLMAFVIMMGSSGVTLSFHFCGHHLASMSLWSDAPNCHELVSKSCCSGKSSGHSCKATTQKECSKKCCTDKEVVLDEDWDFPYYAFETPVFESFFLIQPPMATINQPMAKEIDVIRRVEPPPKDVLTQLSFIQVWRL